MKRAFFVDVMSKLRHAVYESKGKPGGASPLLVVSESVIVVPARQHFVLIKISDNGNSLPKFV